MKVIPFTAIDTICENFNFYPLEGAGEILLAAELERLSRSPEPLTFYAGQLVLVTHEWPCSHGPVEHAYQTYSLATYAATV